MNAHYNTTGVLTRPLITLHTLRDQQVPYFHEQLYDLKTLFSGSLFTRHLNIPIDRFEHCNFTKEEALFSFAVMLLYDGILGEVAARPRSSPRRARCVREPGEGGGAADAPRRHEARVQAQATVRVRTLMTGKVRKALTLVAARRGAGLASASRPRPVPSSGRSAPSPTRRRRRPAARGSSLLRCRRAGRVRVVNDGVVLPQPFLDSAACHHRPAKVVCSRSFPAALLADGAVRDLYVDRPARSRSPSTAAPPRTRRAPIRSRRVRS